MDCTPENKEQRWWETQEVAHEYERRMQNIIESMEKQNDLLQYDEFFVHSPQLDDIAKKEFEKVVAHLDYYGHGDSFCYSIFNASRFRSNSGVTIFPADEMLPLNKNSVEFEGIYYDAFKNCDTLLELEYGDIWNMPSKIYPKHSGEMKDLDKALKTIKLKLDN